MKILNKNKMASISGGADCATKAGFMTGLLAFGVATAFTPFGPIALFATGPIGWGMAALAVSGAYFTATRCSGGY